MNRPPSDASRDDSPEELPRDAWLSEALRHAPDADAAPSVAVRETILRQARAQAAAAPRPARPLSAWQRFNAAWSWLSGPRIAAGFASVMVATVVGLMWWDRPIDEALRPAEAPATVAAPAAAPTPTPAPAPAAEPPAATPPSPSVEPPRDLAAAAPPRVALERKREAKQRADTSKDTRSDVADAAAAAAPAAPAAKRATDEARALADANDSARSENEAKKEVDATRERRAEVAQSKAAAPALRSAPAAAAGALAPAPAPASPPVAAAQSRQSRPVPLGALLEALAEESPRWRWQRDGSGERPWSSEMQAWLQRLDRLAAGRWSSADTGQGMGQGLGQGLGQGSAQAPAQGLRLIRDGGVQAIVRLGTDGTVRVDIAGEPPLSAQLPAASVAALQRALDDAAR